MNAQGFVLQAEMLRQQRDYNAAATLYYVAIQYAQDETAKQELRQRADEMIAKAEVEALERLYAR